MAITENMVTDLVTEADKPVMMAKLHKKTRVKIRARNFPFLILWKGLNSVSNSKYIIPTCRPEMAKM